MGACAGGALIRGAPAAPSVRGGADAGMSAHGLRAHGVRRLLSVDILCRACLFGHVATLAGRLWHGRAESTLWRAPASSGGVLLRETAREKPGMVEACGLAPLALGGGGGSAHLPMGLLLAHGRAWT